jgi:hypothetical protein
LATEAIVQIYPICGATPRLVGSQRRGTPTWQRRSRRWRRTPALLAGITSTADTRVALYRVFTRIWFDQRQGGRSDQLDPASDHARPDHAAAAAKPSCSSRWAFRTNAAAISVPVDKVRTLVDGSGREIAAAIATVLIIEDEPMIAMDLENLVEELGHRCRHCPHAYRGRCHRVEGQPGRSGRHQARRRQLRPRCSQRPAEHFEVR